MDVEKDMRNIERSSQNYIRNVRTISEQEIMTLQDTFLTNGFHTITVSSIKEGRSLLATFINALNCYRNIACLKKTSDELESFFDIYKVLSENSKIDNQLLFNFFLDQFNFDLLCIEMNKQLMKASWFPDFLQQLCDFKIDKNIPIICLAYR